MNSTIIFVSGIHGVGKTTACSQYETNEDIHYISASDIIRTQRNNLITKEKIVADIGTNQDYLLKGLNELKQKYKTILLDSHFTLLDINQSITRVPKETFRSIGMSACIIFIDKPHNIHKRLMARGNTNLTVELLNTMQEDELSHAKTVCSALGTPIHIIDYAEIADSMIFSDIVSAYIYD